MANSSLYSYMYFTLFVLAPLLRQTKVETTGTKMEGNTRRSLEHVHVHVSVTLLPVLGVNRKYIKKRVTMCIETYTCHMLIIYWSWKGVVYFAGYLCVITGTL